jgi:AraC-like DNA-binding protein
MPEPASKGHLNPGDPGVVFDRFELGPSLGAVVRHVWVVDWDLPPGVAFPQRVLSYPAVNVVLQPGGAVLAGPDPRVSITTLEGRSWAVGILFRPAAAALLSDVRPRDLVGAIVPFAPGEAVERSVEVAMRASGGTDARRRRLIATLRAWLLPLAAGVGERGLLANEVGRLAETDPSILRAAELAERMGLGMRALERLVREQIGVTPKWLIECRRLQEAATRLHAHPDTDLSGLAAELGYADYPHFSRRYRQIVGESPTATATADTADAARSAGSAP